MKASTCTHVRLNKQQFILTIIKLLKNIISLILWFMSFTNMYRDICRVWRKIHNVINMLEFITPSIKH